MSSSPVAIIIAHRTFAIIVDNGETSAHWRTKVAVDSVFFCLTGVGGDGRRRAANDGGGNVQQKTEETTHSEQCQGGSGDGGGVRRWQQHAEGVRWWREVEEEKQWPRSSEDGERYQFHFSFVSSNCRRCEMLKP